MQLLLLLLFLERRGRRCQELVPPPPVLCPPQLGVGQIVKVDAAPLGLRALGRERREEGGGSWNADGCWAAAGRQSMQRSRREQAACLPAAGSRCPSTGAPPGQTHLPLPRSAPPPPPPAAYSKPHKQGEALGNGSLPACAAPLCPVQHQHSNSSAHGPGLTAAASLLPPLLLLSPAPPPPAAR